MRFLAAALLLAFVLIVTFDVTSAQSRVDRSASWFKPSPNVRSPQYSRSRLGGSRLLPRRMYRSLPQADYQAMWDKLTDTADSQSDADN
ncbi:hypothetical protein CAEBREN_21020 [Caenorhabditis brenneri]|uniref:Uncharacterized protein n=1 Tax=Caenorhabditis brenneri TaxID=135651 RepID=G0PK38_CAEBE|nr:hypothetical protein CAEBREN_21020 [Caenorhabditis brenneri]